MLLEFLAGHAVHATAEEIFDAVNRRDPRASRATVYNNLRALAKAALVREVMSEGKAARLDAKLEVIARMNGDFILASLTGR